jgi:hypothetical protein
MKILQFKRTTKKKNLLQKLSRTFKMAEERISEPKNKSIEIINLKNKEKENKLIMTKFI